MTTSTLRQMFRPGWAKVALALVVGIGLGYAPAMVSSQGKGRIPDLPPQAKASLGGNQVALVRVVKKDNYVDTYANGNDSVVDDKATGVVFDIQGASDPSAANVTVNATIPKDLLGPAGTPLEVITAGVVIRAGTGTCIWDCYWANGRKICECINI
jgi:hypothetical protein